MSRRALAAFLRAPWIVQSDIAASRHAGATLHQVAAREALTRTAQPSITTAWQVATQQATAAHEPAAARGFAASVNRAAASAQSSHSLLDRFVSRASRDAAQQALQQSCWQQRLSQSPTPRRTHTTSQRAASTPAAPSAKPPAPIPPKQPASPPTRPAPPQRSLWQRTRDAAEVPARALRAVADAGARAASAVAAVSPAPVRRLADSVRSGTGQRVLSLQLEAFWQQHRNKVFILGGVAVVYILWKSLFGVASIFVNLSETMAELGFLAFAAALVAFAGLYLRHRFTINPRAVYRQAMVKLNTSPSVLEVMGPPLAGSDVRAYVMTGGGIRLKGLIPRYRSRRVQMIFPLRGTEKRGLVSLEAKRRKGVYQFKLLAVDVPAASSAEQRLYVEGDAKLYHRGGVINELRDPFLQALSLTKAYEEEDEADDEADDEAEERDRAAAARSRAAAQPKPLDQGGGMYFYERVWWGARGFLDRLFAGKTASAPQGSAGQPPQQQQPQQQQPSGTAPVQLKSGVPVARLLTPAASPATPIIQRVPQTVS